MRTLVECVKRQYPFVTLTFCENGCFDCFPNEKSFKTLKCDSFALNIQHTIGLCVKNVLFYLNVHRTVCTVNSSKSR
jgi:hypothetical protein